MKTFISLITFFFFFTSVAYAVDGVQHQPQTDITNIATSGNSTANPGLSCIKIANVDGANCTAGYVAILNHDKELLSAAYLVKATGTSNPWIYFVDTKGKQYHCPGLVFTDCSLISIGTGKP